MPKNHLPAKKIGILGGGQLARMLCQQGQKWGLEIFVLSENSNDPAAVVSSHWVKGSMYNSRQLNSFASQVDLITFESEFADVEKIKNSLKGSRVTILPQLKNIALLQDRLSQKKALEKNKLNTSPFIHGSNENTYIDFFEAHGAFVAKKRMHGYDGYGTYIVKNKKDLIEFIKNHKNDLSQFIAEKFVPFQRELSLIVARSKNKSFTHFPVVESFQKDAKCFWVKGPTQQKRIPSLIKKIKLFLEKINYVGVIAFELFEHNDQLIINEVAPRVHNTGHHTQDSCNIDQFSMHLLCLLGQDLPKVIAHNKGFAMVNLIGQSTQSPRLALCQHSILHWYQKTHNRPGRKMGHINSVSHCPELALKHCLKDYKGFSL